VAATRTTTSLPSTASTWMSEAERVRAPTASSRGRCNVLGRMSGRTCTRTSTGPARVGAPPRTRAPRCSARGSRRARGPASCRAVPATPTTPSSCPAIGPPWRRRGCRPARSGRSGGWPGDDVAQRLLCRQPEDHGGDGPPTAIVRGASPETLRATKPMTITVARRTRELIVMAASGLSLRIRAGRATRPTSRATY
jgi:hypothetical protein